MPYSMTDDVGSELSSVGRPDGHIGIIRGLAKGQVGIVDRINGKTIFGALDLELPAVNAFRGGAIFDSPVDGINSVL